jgi:predicted transcriptional regulator
MELEAIVVEQILRVCSNESSFNELFDAIRGIVSLSRYILKKYLFYLIETGILSYHGVNQAYIITLEGLNLLYFMNTEKWEGQSGIKNIVICLR